MNSDFTNGNISSGVNYTCNNFENTTFNYEPISINSGRIRRDQAILAANQNNPFSPLLTPTNNTFFIAGKLIRIANNYGNPAFKDFLRYYYNSDIPNHDPQEGISPQLANYLRFGIPISAGEIVECPMMRFPDDITISQDPCCFPVMQPCCILQEDGPKEDDYYSKFISALNQLKALYHQLRSTTNEEQRAEIENSIQQISYVYNRIRDAFIHTIYFKDRQYELDDQEEFPRPTVHGKSLMDLIKEDPTYEYILWGLKESVSRGESPNEILNKIPSISESELQNYNTLSFFDIFDIIKNKNIDNLSIEEMQFIQTTAEGTENTLGRSWARGIMTSRTGQVYHPDIVPLNPIETNVVSRSASNSVLLYPNPSYDIVTINWDLLNLDSSEFNDNVIIRFSDISGKSILSQNISNSSQTISVKELRNGVYFYTIQNNKKEIASGKLVKIE